MFKRLCKLAAVLAALLGTPITASAALVQFDFGGIFTNSTTVLGLPIVAGQTLTGAMSYDSAISPTPLFAGPSPL